MHGGAYILRRLGLALLTIAFVAVLNFFLFRVLPGDPARVVQDPRLTREAREAHADERRRRAPDQQRDERARDRERECAHDGPRAGASR